MKQVIDLTCCRALFALGVFTYHVNLQSHYAPLLGRAGNLVHEGYLGVDGFFILSGIVLAYAHRTFSTTVTETRLFLLKRLARIYPVHLATIGLFMALFVLGMLFGLTPREPDRFGLDELVRHLTLVHAWGFSDRWAWNYPSWSISAEWGGYLVFPLLWPRLRDAHHALLAMLLVLAAVAEYAAQWAGLHWRMSLTFDGGLLRFYPEFIAGMATVPLMPHLARWLPSPVLLLAGIACIATGALVFDGAEVLVIYGLWMLLAGLLLRAYQGGGSLLGWIPGAKLFGELSYSFYMSFAFTETVQATLWRSRHVLADDQKLLYGVTTFLLTLALSLLLWNGIEKPALRAFARRRRAPLAIRTTDVTS
jgi:peptidoglycan/LPS O-acetylase OafA/YrhL